MTQMTDDVRRLIKAGDLPGAVRSLRPHAETAPLADLAKAAKYLAEAAGFDDLAKAAKAVTADVSGLLAQHTVAPWAENGQRPADTRPVEEIARDIVTSDPAPDGGDGQTPADPDEALRGFTAAVAAGWLDGPRDRVRSCGPVRSSRFG
ncbi:hypothetical protein [Streptomyces sp. KS 21]|uniref:hypothetical protein n=1 Tax=Streptomyces sp. KS 21 TaxID=2485150 RepID=UPI0010640375|nr:hypothetical protein [Streptomyces sp. KS 21]TDU74821.1 hypothetical protein EDD91_1480 [Streptomyces sp. KS 21]